VIRALRWIGGLVVMAAIWLGVSVALVEVGVGRWLAGMLGVLVAVSIVEPRSYLRQGIRKWRARRRSAGA
jgi:hypothetical protein